MFERFRRRTEARQDTPANGTAAVRDPEQPDGRTAVMDRDDRDTYADDPRTGVRGRRAAAAPVAADVLAERRERQRREFGGLDWPAAFFGWLVAIGVATLRVANLTAAGTAIGITQVSSTSDAAANADTIGIVGAALLLLALLIAYFAGGYVAGRMARFDGARQGFAVWAIALAITLVLAAAGAVLGAKYNVFQQLNLPRIPVDEGTLTTGGLIALAAIALGTLLAAILGGKAGDRYHHRIDRYVD
jgi:hypothetical protein